MNTDDIDDWGNKMVWLRKYLNEHLFIKFLLLPIFGPIVLIIVFIGVLAHFIWAVLVYFKIAGGMGMTHKEIIQLIFYIFEDDDADNK